MVWQLLAFASYLHDYANRTHYAWQAGIRYSAVRCFINPEPLNPEPLNLLIKEPLAIHERIFYTYLCLINFGNNNQEWILIWLIDRI